MLGIHVLRIQLPASVIHGSFCVLESTELPAFICRFLRRIDYDSTHVEFAGTTRRQFFTARGVRQGCPASGFFFAMAFDPIFRWLQDAIIPRNPVGLDFLQPAQCAYADDFAVAASSFRDLMTALAPAFHSVDHIAGLRRNFQKCCWVQYGGEGRESLLRWLSDNCEDFREMPIVRHAKYVGTMIGPDGHIHRLTAPRKNHPARSENQCLYRKHCRATVRLQDLCGVCFKLYRFHLRT